MVTEFHYPAGERDGIFHNSGVHIESLSESTYIYIKGIPDGVSAGKERDAVIRKDADVQIQVVYEHKGRNKDDKELLEAGMQREQYVFLHWRMVDAGDHADKLVN